MSNQIERLPIVTVYNDPGNPMNREKLAALCGPVKPFIKMMDKTVNEWLKEEYQAAIESAINEPTLCDWDTFKGWKKRGRSVYKGEKGFKVWSAPQKTVKGEDGKYHKLEDGERPEDGERASTSYWIVTIFHIEQTHEIEG